MPQHIDVHKQFASFFDETNTQTAAHAVSKKLADGHTCINIENYNNEIQQNEINEHDTTPIFTQKIDITELKKSNWVTENTENTQPFVLNNGNLYMHRYYCYETDIIEQIKKLIENESGSGFFNEDALLQHKDFILHLFSDHTILEENTSEENINWQLVAAISSILSNFSIITGGPGTGKTTTVAKLLAILYTIKPELKVALAAPTGKAAARMKESLMAAGIRSSNGQEKLIREINNDLNSNFNKLNATTLHRLLGYRHGTHYFKHDKSNPLDYDVVLIDEASMIGASMMAKLLQAIKPSAKIIMLGDKDQLASVEAGSIFGDICLTQKECMNSASPARANLINSFIPEEKAKVNSSYFFNSDITNPLQEHIIELKKSWRFKSSEGIGEFSHAVINGNVPDELIEKPKPESGQYVSVNNDYNSKELNELIDNYQDYINEGDIAEALKNLNNVRMLCAVRSGNFGVNHYNELIEEYLNKKGLISPGDSFYENRPIMITQNDKEQNLFNGDVGIIRKDKDKDKFMAYFEDPDSEMGFRALPTTYLSEFTTVFCMTIHKSQGSEFKHVGIVLPGDENTPLLTRELIYTAITRAKESVVIFSSNEVLKKGSINQVERASGITKRFINQKN
ncbi:MAG: exodeoxyribonuclease V subunit alpha [Salinivirgaceae bacterium]|nr:exodeoxyribonuclease V subunit alpha [Salinivirgaceae bacterium]